MTLREALEIVLINEHLADRMLYAVRDRCAEDATFKGNSWQHPRVLRLNQACKVLTDELSRLEAAESCSKSQPSSAA